MARNGHSGALTQLGAGVSAIRELDAMVHAADDPKSAMELRERMAEVELALEDLGWVRMDWQTRGQLSRQGLRRLTTICRMLYLKHPLINHAVNVQTNYVWGQGVTVVAHDSKVNKVVQAWWDLKENKQELTGHRARMLKERELMVAGNVFLALFSDPVLGTVRVRSILEDEIENIVTNPDDRREVWYYHRRWSEATSYDIQLGLSTVQGVQEAYYPDWLHQPESKPPKFNGVDIKWESPVYHMKVGGLDNMLFGVPEIFPAVDWARAVQKDLENYATVKASLARYSQLLTIKGSPAVVAAAKKMLATTIGPDTSSGESNPPAVAGSIAIQREGAAKLEPIKTAGIQANPDEGRRLGLMVSAGTGIPETMLWGDATIGNYATAKSLDRPTELQMTARQEDWVDTFTDVIGYAIDQNALSTRGKLRGKLVADEYSGAKSVQITGVADRRLDIQFPAILEHDALATVQAIIGAATLNGQALAGLIDRETLARKLLVALGVDNVDEVLANLPDEPLPTPKDDLPPPPVVVVAPPAVDPAVPDGAPPEPAPAEPDAQATAGAEARA